MEEKRARINYLVETLNAASEAYYGGREETMTNYEWDALYDELGGLEAETGYIREDSPTHSVSHSSEEQSSAEDEEPHEYPALSLAKTKKIEDLQAWAGERDVWVSWKLDGVTLVVTFDGGVPVKILSRGNGIVGKNLSHLIGSIIGIPDRIADQGHLVVRGEATISYPDFEQINELLSDGGEEYANPRNLVSGTISLDKSNLAIVKERRVTFNAFTLVHIDRPMPSWGNRLDYLSELGFCTVARERTNAERLPEVIARWTKEVENNRMPIPVDGLVINYDDTEYAATGSVTGHHATRAGLAFKWQDVSAATTLRYIEWSCAASTITPVAVFDPVQLEGTTVSRASLCNISELKRLEIGENGKTEIEVIKANKIIPKVISVIKKEGEFSVPTECPVCGAPAVQHQNGKSGTITLKCTNGACPAKHLKRFQRFVSKAGMDIDGLSVETLKVFINKGFLKDYADIYGLGEFRDEIVEMDGFGEKSCGNLLAAIEKSRKVTLPRFLYALGIPLIGGDAAARIVRALGSEGFYQRIADREGFADVDGIGTERSNAVLAWFDDEENQEVYKKLLSLLDIEPSEPVTDQGGKCAGLVFVITGSVHQFQNRKAFKEYVQSQGGSVTESVSQKTDYLVNNDMTSNSSKNKKAKELHIPILSEDEFVERFGS